MGWQPSYATAADLASWLGVPNEGTELALATEAASRAIDQATGRQFGLLSSSEFRWYTAEFYRDRWLIEIDDLMTDTSLTVEVDNDQDGVPEAAITACRLTPVNAAAVGKPWTRIEVLPGSGVKPTGVRHGVRVSARWGWTNVPNAIKYATLLQAGRFYERRENISGVLTRHKVDDIELGWSSGAVQDLDPDVLASIKPYQRLWVAA